MEISCSECVRRHTEHCADCVVTFVLARGADDAVVLDLDEIRAVRALHDAGLVPELRHEPRTG